MNENFFNQVVKKVESRSKIRFPNPDFKSHVVLKSLIQSIDTYQTPVDSINQSSSAEQLLINHQLPTDEENIKITSSFLNKGFSPSKEEIENIKLVMQSLSDTVDIAKARENAVSITILGLDIKNEIIKQSISNDIDEKKVKQIFKELQSEAVKDNNIPTKVRIEISQIIDQVQKEIDENILIEVSNSIGDSEEVIAEKLKINSNQSAEKKLQNVTAIASNGLERIIALIEEGVSVQIQKNKLLQNTNEITDKIVQLKNKLSIDRESLVSNIDATTKEFIAVKESIQKLTGLIILKNTATNETTIDSFHANIPALLKSLNNSDAIIAQFGDYISSFPQSLSSINSTANNSSSLNNALLSNSLTGFDTQELSSGQVASQNNQIDIKSLSNQNINDILNTLENSLASNPTANNFTLTPNNSIGSVQDQFTDPWINLINNNQSSDELSTLTNTNSSVNLLYQIITIADSLKDNLQAIKNLVNQTALLPASISLKELAKLFRENNPDFFTLFDTLNLDINDFPELQKIQASISAGNLRDSFTPTLSDVEKLVVSASTSKTINLENLRKEIENIEREYFKTNDSVQSLKKINEVVAKTVGKLAVHQLIENASTKPQTFHVFELSISPLQEIIPTKVEIQHNRNIEDSQIKNSFSVNIEINLSQTGAIRAQLISTDLAKQIFLNFGNIEFKNLAEENNDEFISALKEIPFVTKIFFGTQLFHDNKEKNPSKPKNETSSSEHKFDSFA